MHINLLKAICFCIFLYLTWSFAQYLAHSWPHYSLKTVALFILYAWLVAPLATSRISVKFSKKKIKNTEPPHQNNGAPNFEISYKNMFRDAETDTLHAGEISKIKQI